MLSNIGYFHPQVVHFVIALLFVGIFFRLVSLTGKLAFTGPAATSLILIGTVAAWLAVWTGDRAHGPVQRIPGVREEVEEHEEWGERTRNIFTVVALLELAALATAKEGRRRTTKLLAVGSTALGLAGLFALYEAAEHGGAIVYDYGGGPGLRSGDQEAIERLLVAGLYNQAMAARRAGRVDEAARLVGDLRRMRPADWSVELLVIESLLQDRGDPAGAMAALAALPPTDNFRQLTQRGILRADAHVRAGNRDSALVILTELERTNPDNPRIKAKADSLR